MVLDNVTGWNELMTGNVTQAAYLALDVPLGGLLIPIIYTIIMMVLWGRTQSVELCAVMSLIFFGFFMISPWFNTTTKYYTGIVTVFFLASTLFKMIAKERN